MNGAKFLGIETQESLERLRKSLELSPDNNEKLEINKSDLKPILESVEILSKEQLNEQKNLLNFLKETTIKQSETADKQSRNNLHMTRLALVFAFISIIPIIKEWIYPNESKNLYQNIFELEKQISSESKRNLEMYKNLLDLQNQVGILEKQNEQLNEKLELKKR